ncbi:collagen alpha-1(XXV) chain isoform X8 [Silurus asotus]|uniref:Collagen alpha-1(XXV) chain isoform X8 n=1 Tax=Silurus asotus TaxID=30991 RepID=A0AAD5A405_SILAS|nr:collagen alpha-1(XXV) chain isoform X8 [Silurus asotus]
MESDSRISGKRHYLRTITGAIPIVFSVASVAFCIFLEIQTSDMKNRMLDLENSDGERLLHPFAQVSIDEFNSMVQERVHEVLSQRSYEHFARVRTARQAPPDCNCPPVTWFTQRLPPLMSRLAYWLDFTCDSEHGQPEAFPKRSDAARDPERKLKGQRQICRAHYTPKHILLVLQTVFTVEYSPAVVS